AGGGWAATGGPQAAAAKAHLRHLGDQSPWVLGAGGIVAAFFVGWFASVLSSFQHAGGLTGQGRVLRFFGVGSFEWAIGILLGVGLIAVGRRFDPKAMGPGRLKHLVDLGLLLAACGVGVSAGVDFLVELTNFGHGIDAALSGLVAYAGVLPLAAAAMWWAHRQRID
ncbi:MAG: hypothetical protein ACRDYY_03985, partial [Acidimicrobiales bacterium]